MPYIDKDRRVYLHYRDNQYPETPGDLNFCITELCKHYTNSKGLSYSTINEVVGVLTCASNEYYRRVATPYENNKCINNGDVYDQEGE